MRNTNTMQELLKLLHGERKRLIDFVRLTPFLASVRLVFLQINTRVVIPEDQVTRTCHVIPTVLAHNDK